MKKMLMAILLALNTMPAVAQTVLRTYQPGFRLIDGNKLNLMVDQVNNLTGNGSAGSNVKLSNGTVALPSLSFFSDTDTGIYRIGANNIGIAANGAKVLDIGTTGLAVTGLLSATTLAVTGASTFTGALNANAHINTGATPPVLTSCGTGSPAITGSDTAGIVTLGTSATGCVITFAAAYTVTPYCVVSWIASPLASQSYATSNTAITLTQTSTSGNKVQYVCYGPFGG